MNLGWTVIGIMLFATVLPPPAHAQWWNPLSPDDFEECAEQAAKDGKTQAGLGILLKSCQTKFPARRNTNGKGYVFFDVRTGNSVQVSSPGLSPTDKQRIEEAYREHVQRQAARDAVECEQERRQVEEEGRAWEEYGRRVTKAGPLVKILSHRVHCDSKIYCAEKTITASVKNGSGETLQAVYFGWVLSPGPPKSLSCPSSFEQFKRVNADILPGQTASLSLSVRDGPTEGEFSYCVNIYAVLPTGAPDGSWRDFPSIYLNAPTNKRCAAAK